ncbi:MAG: hypothetical protein ABI220_03735 [Candidatus Saccharimonadales bacterium]
MKVIVLYRPDSEHARAVEEFIHDLQRQHNIDASNLDVLNVDSRDGSATASLYDVMSYPTVLVVQGDGSLIKSWDGGGLPMMNEVAGYTFAH